MEETQAQLEQADSDSDMNFDNEELTSVECPLKCGGHIIRYYTANGPDDYNTNEKCDTCTYQIEE